MKEQVEGCMQMGSIALTNSTVKGLRILSLGPLVVHFAGTITKYTLSFIQVFICLHVQL